MSNKSLVDEYILVMNDQPITANIALDDFISINKSIIPEAPVPPILVTTNNTYLKIKTRYRNFNHYKKCLKNKRKRQRKKRHN